MRVCHKCRQEKQTFDFYKGYTACKSCVCAAVRKRRRLNPAVQEYDRERAKTPARKKKARAITISWRKRHPEAYRAQNIVNNAVRDGHLTKQPCMFCGETKVHAHHRDYNKPLEVTWLCAKCHHRLHAVFPETEGHKAA